MAFDLSKIKKVQDHGPFWSIQHEDGSSFPIFKHEMEADDHKAIQAFARGGVTGVTDTDEATGGDAPQGLVDKNGDPIATVGLSGPTSIAPGYVRGDAGKWLAAHPDRERFDWEGPALTQAPSARAGLRPVTNPSDTSPKDPDLALSPDEKSDFSAGAPGATGNRFDPIRPPASKTATAQRHPGHVDLPQADRPSANAAPNPQLGPGDDGFDTGYMRSPSSNSIPGADGQPLFGNNHGTIPRTLGDPNVPVPGASQGEATNIQTQAPGTVIAQPPPDPFDPNHATATSPVVTTAPNPNGPGSQAPGPLNPSEGAVRTVTPSESNPGLDALGGPAPQNAPALPGALNPNAGGKPQVPGTNNPGLYRSPTDQQGFSDPSDGRDDSAVPTPEQLAAQARSKNLDDQIAATFKHMNTLPGVSGGQFDKQYLQGLQGQKDALSAQEGPVKEFYRQRALLDDLVMKNHREITEKWATDHANNEKAMDDITADIKSFKLDPNRLFHNKDTGPRNSALLGIASALGTFGSVMTKTPNYALQLVEQNINNDIDAQKNDINKKITQVGMLRAHGHDINEASELARANMLTIVGAQADRLSNTMESSVKAQELRRLGGALTAQGAADRSTLATQGVTRAATVYSMYAKHLELLLYQKYLDQMSNGLGPDMSPQERGIVRGGPESTNNHMIDITAPRVAVRNTKGKVVGYRDPTDTDGGSVQVHQTRLLQDPKLREKATEAFEAIQEQQVRTDELNDIYKKAGDRPLLPGEKKLADAAVAGWIMANPKVGSGLNRNTEIETDLSHMIAPDTGKISWDVVDPAIARAKINAMYKRNSEARSSAERAYLTPHEIR